MGRSLFRFLLCFVLLSSVAAGYVGENIALAQDSSQGTLSLTTDFPVLRGKSGEKFVFSIGLNWIGTVAKNFNLSVTTPPQWSATITRSYPTSEVAAIRMEANRDFTEKFDVTFSSFTWQQPQPGEYVVTLNAVSDDGAIKQSIDLKAIVTAIYSFRMATSNGNLNAQVTAGDANPLSIVLANNGTAALQNITFSTTKPDGWEVNFSPSSVNNIDPGSIQEVKVSINPPGGDTIAGDYMVTLTAENTEFSPEPLRVRVTVLTPSFWGWVSILIVAAVIGGLALLFWRVGRR